MRYVVRVWWAYGMQALPGYRKDKAGFIETNHNQRDRPRWILRPEETLPVRTKRAVPVTRILIALLVPWARSYNLNLMILQITWKVGEQTFSFLIGLSSNSSGFYSPTGLRMHIRLVCIHSLGICPMFMLMWIWYSNGIHRRTFPSIAFTSPPLWHIKTKGSSV